ncbi:hypothetical protein LINPERPRIM_LOCUS2714 [Linum perenne]
MNHEPQQSDYCVEIGESLVWSPVKENFLLDTMLEEMNVLIISRVLWRRRPSHGS